MPSTSLGFPYPASTSTVNVPSDIQALAEANNTYATTNNTFVSRKDGVQAVSSIARSATITSQAIVLTLPSCVFSAGRAYSIEMVGGIDADASGRLGDFSVYKTNLAGTQYGAFYRVYAGIGGAQTSAYGKFYVRRSAGTDLTTDIVLSLAASAGNVTHDAASNRPRALVVRDVGTAAAYSWAFDVT